jgi:hypothetical protein
MGTTNFPTFVYLDTLGHTHVNNIQTAINNLEAAINITPGTTNAAIPSEKIANGLDAAKLLSSSDASIRRLFLSETLTVAGDTALTGTVSLGVAGAIKVTGNGAVEILKLGRYDVGAYGLRVTDGTNTNLLVNSDGQVSLRGIVTALDGSDFTGMIHVQGGTIAGDVNVGGTDGISLKGVNKQIVVNQLGKIVAGTNEITATDILFKRGTIDIGTKFHVAADGTLVATGVDISGRVTVTDGDLLLYAGTIGGATIGADSISVGGSTSATTGFSLMSSGDLYAKKAHVTGDVNITSGTLTLGDLTLSGAGRFVSPFVTISATGINITAGTFSLGSGRFTLNNGVLVCSDANVTGSIYMTSGNIQGQVTVGSSATLKFDGPGQRFIAGASGLTPTGIDFKQGSVTLGFGQGTYGPGGDQNYRLYVATDGRLSAKDVTLQGTFSGSFNITGGTMAGWQTDADNIYSGTTAELNKSLFVLNKSGVLTSYSDRIALGAGHTEASVLIINNTGLTVNSGAINLTTAISGGQKLLINNTGIRSQYNATNEVVMDGTGIKCIYDGVDLGYIVTPAGLAAFALADHSLGSIKFKDIKPRMDPFVSASSVLRQTVGGDFVDVTLTWKVPTLKEDDSNYDDGVGFRIYLKETGEDALPCIQITDIDPDYPEINDPEHPQYKVKTFVLKNLKPGTQYTAKVSTFDKLGNESVRTQADFTTLSDLTNPPEIGDGNFTVSSTNTTINGQWVRCSDIAFSYYQVDRCYSSDDIDYSSWFPFTDTTANMFVDATADPDTWYRYRVRPVDRDGKTGAWTYYATGIKLVSLISLIGENAITSEMLAQDISIDGTFNLVGGGISIGLDKEFLGIVSTGLDTTPLDATPPDIYAKGIAVRNLFVGGDYNEWDTIFNSATPLLANDPGNAYIGGDLYVTGRVGIGKIADTDPDADLALDINANVAIRSTSDLRGAWLYLHDKSGFGINRIRYTTSGLFAIRDDLAGIDRIFIGPYSTQLQKDLFIIGGLTIVPSEGAANLYLQPSGGVGINRVRYKDSGLFAIRDDLAGIDRIFINSLGQVGINKVPDAGNTLDINGTLKTSSTVIFGGALTLPGRPTSANHAATKEYAEAYTQSRGMNLVTNGSGLLGDNYNFSTFTFDQVENYSGKGSFKCNVGAATRYSDELIPVDTDRFYRLSLWAKSTTYVAGNHSYFGIVPYDIDGWVVIPTFYKRIAGTDTTLAQPLKPGDTVVYLTSAANFNNATGTNGWDRALTIWKWKSSYGYAYLPYTYSRYTTTKQSWTPGPGYMVEGGIYDGALGVNGGAWADGAVDFVNNTITLRAPWPAGFANPDDPVEGAWPAGTPISNGGSSGTFKYIAASNVVVPNAWTNYTGVIGGPDTLGSAATANLFPLGTAFIKVLMLMNRDVTGNVTNISTVHFSEIVDKKDANSTYITGVNDGANLYLQGYFGTAINRIRYYSNGAGTQFAIRDEKNNADRITIINTGEIGIGKTPTAGYKLDVPGVIRVNSNGNALRFGHNNENYVSALGSQSLNGWPFLAFHAEHSTTANQYKNDSSNCRGFVIEHNAVESIKMIFNGATTAGDFTNPSVHLTIKPTKVGIFTTDPSYSLHVVGNVGIVGGLLILEKTILAAGTTGNATINKPMGRVNIAAGQTAISVSNSLVTADSIVMAVIASNDTTSQIKNVVPGSSTFTINLVSAATAETPISFLVIN